MKKEDLIIIIYSTVIIALTINVDVTKSDKHKDSKSHKKYDYEEDEPSTASSVEKKNELLKKMRQFKNIKPPPLVTYGPYTFEGVDYHDMPKDFYKNYHDCYYDHLRCIRYKPNLYIVCVYHLWWGWMDITNQCQVDLTNCLYRLEYFKGFYGTNFQSDLLFYNGDGEGCYETLRKGKSPDQVAVDKFLKQGGARKSGVKTNYVSNDTTEYKK